MIEGNDRPHVEQMDSVEMPAEEPEIKIVPESKFTESYMLPIGTFLNLGSNLRPTVVREQGCIYIGRDRPYDEAYSQVKEHFPQPAFEEAAVLGDTVAVLEYHSVHLEIKGQSIYFAATHPVITCFAENDEGNLVEVETPNIMDVLNPQE